VPDCPVCAFDNPPSADVCGDCGAPLRVTAPATEPVASTLAGGRATERRGPDPGDPDVHGRLLGGETGPAGSRQDGRDRAAARKKGADLALESADLAVDPGSAVTVTVTVHNLGDQVEQFTLAVTGPGGRFATADPADLHMLPDKKQTAVLRFAPARDPRQAAGPHPFQVVARSTVNPDVVARASGVVTVGGFAQLEAELTPELTRGRQPGTHRLQVVNAGNEPVAVECQLHDETGELVFEPPGFGGRLAPGVRQEQAFTVVGPQEWFGRTKPFPFTLDVASTGRPQPVQLRAVRRQVPRFPWWVPTVALALVGIAVAVIALLPHHKDLVPSVAGLNEAAAVAKLSADGYTAVPIKQSDEARPEGQAIGTEPVGGAELSDGESVSLFVSAGRCPDPCPLPVPGVVGLPVDKAVKHLERARLRPVSTTEVSAEQAGKVLRTEPATGTTVLPNSDVAVIASAGPTPTTAPASSAGSTGSTPGSTSATGGSTGTTTGSAPQASASPTTPAQSGGSSTPQAPVKVPDVMNLSLSNALSALKVLGYVVTLKPQHTNDAARDVVLQSDPPANQVLAPGSAVTLTVADPTQLDLNPVIDRAVWSAASAPLGFPTDDGSLPAARRQPPSPGVSVGDLVTQPVPGGSLTARVTLPDAIIPGDHLRADLAITEGAGDVEISVLANGKPLPTPLTSATVPVPQLDVDLTSAAGSTVIDITLRGLPLPTPTSTPTTAPQQVGADQVVWKGLRVEGVTK
jgi:beta-lactam-binding protein with PASTA domain